MKSPEYVRDVTARWRELIDAERNADRRDMEYLASVFGRGGHTDAYFTRKIGVNMLGVRSDADKRESASQERFEDISRKIPIELSASVKAGEPSRLSARVGERTVTVYGATPETARTAPISKETLIKNLSKLGTTVYRLENISVELDEGLILPISAINALRRSAIDALKGESERSESDFTFAKKEIPTKKREKIRSAVFYQLQKMPSSATDFFNYIYIPLEKYSERRLDGLGVMLPEVIFDSERAEVERMLKNAYDEGARDALVGNIGHIELAKRAGFRVHGDIRLNAFNNSSVAELENFGVEDVILSPELTLPQIRDIGGASGVCVYGRLPLMITEKCVGKEIGGCEVCESGSTLLTDRRGAEFPVLKRFKHRSAIFNSLPTYMADKRGELERAHVSFEHFIFTVEEKKEAEAVIDAYKRGLEAPFSCRRIK